MPKVKISTASSTAFATGAGTASISKPTAPASSMAMPSSITRSAFSAVLPCSLKPPYWCMKCGHMPTWLITGTPASAMARMVGAFSRPPCILTTSAPPSFIRRTAFITPTSGVA